MVSFQQGVIKSMEEKTQPLIVPSILEHEAITGLSGNKPGGMRGKVYYVSFVCNPLSTITFYTNFN